MMSFKCLYFVIISDLLTKDYTETYYQEDGAEVTTTPDDIVSVSVGNFKLYLQNHSNVK